MYWSIVDSQYFFSFCCTAKWFSYIYAMLCYAKSFQSCPTRCDPIDGNPPGFPVPGILQARTLEWVAISFSNAWKRKGISEVAQLCPTLRDPMDCSLPGSSVHGIFQARVLEWGAIASPVIFIYVHIHVCTYMLHMYSFIYKLYIFFFIYITIRYCNNSL